MSMRLLHFNQSGRLMLKDFRDKAVPPYAILSHRWGSSEVLFEDLGKDKCKEKDGYQKIEFCAKRLAEDQLQYFWVDTCCIDKWNLRELSHSINSMFHWYRNAAKCYVFLSDVSVSTATEVRERTSWELSFRTSEWFTRGWTLQELIAPQQVEFYSRQGQRIGDKTSLGQLVYEITDIPHKVLQNCPLDRFSIAERKTWAANRKTTEEEDIVYCLLGILGFSMPVDYGEKKDTALRRLQMVEEEAAGRAPCIIPFSQNAHFVGGEPQLAELEAKLFSNKQTTTLAIVGHAGTGKSQLALELAYRTRQKYKNCSVFWIDASNRDSLFQSYTSIAQKLDIHGWDEDNVDIKVKDRLEGESTKHFLLILDHIEDVSLGSDDKSANYFIDRLPQSELCSILCTTSNSCTVKKLILQHVVELQGLGPLAAQRMLDKYLDASVCKSEQQEAALLLNELSHLPLAIVQAAAYIKATGLTLQEYRSNLNRLSDAALKPSGGLPRWEDPVAATVFISIDQIYSINELASEYICLAACVGSKDIPLDLFPSSSWKEREEAIKVLSKYKLVTRRPAESALSIHQLVHRGIREWLQKQEMLDLWTRGAITRLCCIFPPRNHSRRSKWRRLYPHTQWVLSHSLSESGYKDRLILASMCAEALHSDGWYNEAEKLLVEVKEAREKILGKEHPDTLLIMANLAATYRKQGRSSDAEELLLAVVEMKKRVPGEKHRSTLTSMNGLASTYADQGRWKDAEELFVKVVEARRELLGEDDPQTQDSISNLATIYRKQDLWEKAEEVEVQVLEMRMRTLGEEHPDTLRIMSNLATGYSGRQQWSKAEELDTQVLETRKRVLGKEHPDTLISMFNLANTLQGQSRDEEAMSLLEAHFVLSSRVLGEQHPLTKLSLQKMLEWDEEVKVN
jgi:tetratricopeptide (TPR) repeat protein